MFINVCRTSHFTVKHKKHVSIKAGRYTTTTSRYRFVSVNIIDCQLCLTNCSLFKSIWFPAQMSEIQIPFLSLQFAGLWRPKSYNTIMNLLLVSRKSFIIQVFMYVKSSDTAQAAVIYRGPFCVLPFSAELRFSIHLPKTLSIKIPPNVILAV
jgi:hypothetical protein